jgi:hypothetical protein
MLMYSTWWHPEDIEKSSAIWNQMIRKNPENQGELRNLAFTGRHWMISPGRQLELTHVVQQPVEPPEILDMLPDRNYDRSDCLLNVKFRIHGFSTLKIDLVARWQETIDQPHKVGPEVIDRTGEINDILIDYHDKEKTRGSFPDPKNLKPAIKGALIMKAIDLANGPLKQQFGDTKHRIVNYQSYSTSRYQEYFTKLIELKGLSVEREGPVFEKVIIPSSKQPDPPSVEYVIPTLEWGKSETAIRMRHVRRGGGLRIYLNRPWFSSGENEKLAVLIRSTVIDNRLTLKGQDPVNFDTRITQWAVDPIKLSRPSGNTGPVADDFRYSPEIDSGLSYPGNEPGTVDAVAYPVRFDTERKLWFADIGINPGTMYFPFVKLVLARYQKHSVRQDGRDVCLSNPVFPDFIQLLPERICTVDFRKDDINSRFTITIEGNISLISGDYAAPGNYFEISFLSSELAQPFHMVIDDGTNDKKLEDERAVMHINEKDVKNDRFIISREFKLPRSYKRDPFIILVKEFESGTMSGQSGRDRMVAAPDADQQPRLVFADRFDINAEGIID